MQDEHARAAEAALTSTPVFADRLRGVFLAWVEVAEPYHEFAGKFFKNAAEPTSPLSPFSPESAPARDASIAIFRRVLDGSDLRLTPALRGERPELLWLLHMWCCSGSTTAAPARPARAPWSAGPCHWSTSSPG